MGPSICSSESSHTPRPLHPGVRRLITVFSPVHALRNPRTELSGGELVRPFESAARAQFVLQRIRDQKLGDVVEPEEFGLEPLLRVHDPQYLEFLSSAWDEWLAAENRGEAIPDVWPARRMRPQRPNSITGKLGYYAMAAETSISAGTWEAARAAANVALSGAQLLKQGARCAFALCRPPGHHAARDLFGGYCFINNAAAAAQLLRDGGAARVAILDVDFHHGNGTQDIFYERADVLFVSLHADPKDDFPYFSGYADETGMNAGSGFTLNLPLPTGTSFEAWQVALGIALARIQIFKADALVVSLGVDTYVNDPISSFRLTSPDFAAYGRMLGATGLPTLFVLEGGYAVEEIGVNVVNVLTGFESGAAA
jgi:acetoin utilization deacetylase AcuC-like enzyme